jgi:Ca-activated chloride channel homolog
MYMLVRNGTALLLFSLFVTSTTTLNAESNLVIRKTISEVQVAVVATDHHGRSLPALAPTDIAVLDDGQPVPSFQLRSAGNLPLRLGIVVDLSDSTATTWPVTRAAVADFLQQLMRPGDQVVVLGFDTTIKFQKVVTDPQQLKQVLSVPQSGGQTALLDTVYSACEHDMFNGGEPRRSALIIFSDGEDNLSRHGLDEAIEDAQLRGIAAYTVSTHDRRIQYRGDTLLHHLAIATGGHDFVISKPKDLRTSLATIGGELRSYYLLNYRPPHESGRREFRSVRLVPTQNRGTRLRYREGYFTAPEPKAGH